MDGKRRYSLASAYPVFSDVIAASPNFGAFRGYETKVQLNI
jgi:hypothetical protein